MVPSAFVVLDHLPLTPHGKLDRAALPDPSDALASGGREYVAPRTEAERAVAEAFAAVLGVDRVGSRDEFFELGGHSLLATRVASRIGRSLGREPALRTLFENPSVEGLARALAEPAAGGEETDGDGDAPPLEPLPAAVRRRGVPLSFAQERLWILDQLEPGQAAFVMPFAVRLRGPLEVPALATAFAEVIRRHEALRTAFLDGDDGPRQAVRPPGAPSLPVIDLSGLSGPRRRAASEAALRALDRRPFDLAGGELLRAALLRELAAEGPGRSGRTRVHGLHVAVHHIAADGASVEVLLRELGRLYGRGGAAAEAAASELPELPLQYGDFATWQRRWLEGGVRRRQLAYWRARLADAPDGGTELPLDRPRPAVQSFRGGRRRAQVGADLAERLERLGRARGASLFMTLLAGLAVVLGRLAGEEDVVVGSPVAGRDRPEIEPLIGIFLNTLVLRNDLSGAPSFEELLARVRKTTLGAFSHQDVPFKMLLGDLQPARDLARTPYFQVFLNMFRSDLDRASLPGLGLEVIDAPEPPSKFDLTLYVTTPGDRIRFEAVYNADLFDAATIDRMLGQLGAVLEQAAAAPGRPIAGYSLRTPEMARVLPDPTTPLDGTWHGPIHGALERAARSHPDRLAVADPGRAWTYRHLARAAAAVAARLVAAGVGPGDAVAIHAHRSAALAAAAFGVLRAGGVFVLLDPAYPGARLAAMAGAARPAALVALAAAGEPVPELTAALDAAGAVRLDLAADGRVRGEDRRAPTDRGRVSTDGGRGADAEPPGSADRRDRPPPAAPVGPDDPAVLGFTSGSTGRPKGIVGRHGSLTHFLPWQCASFRLTEHDRFSALSGLAHDPLQRDLFTPVWLGAAVVLPDPDALGEPGALARWMERERITVSHMTPAMLHLVAEGAAARLEALRRVLLVGDVLTRRDVAQLRDLAPRAECINLYGSTETQRAVSFHRVAAGEAGPPAAAGEVLPLGKGMAGCQLVVLELSRGGGNDAGSDEPRAAAAIGEVGEIAVRSPHLALGYLDDPARTAERFVRNPFTGREDDRLYRTGDLGRYLADGSVAFLGRADQQVKIRGLRVELGEVEAHLAALPAVRDAVALAHDDPTRGRFLVGYAAIGPEEEGRGRPEPEALRRALAGRLPSAMVPASVVVVDRLPLTPNRKVDRKALRRLGERLDALPGPGFARPAGEPPRSPLERTVAELFGEVLGLDPRAAVPRDAEFFSLGGHSILATRLVARLGRRFGVPVALRLLFEHPTVAGVAAILADAGAEPSGDLARPIPRLPRPADPEASFERPLSPGQRRLWFLDRLAPGSNAYTMAGALALTGRLDLPALAGAFGDVIRRHEVLRTVFAEREGGAGPGESAGPVQVVLPAAGVRAALPVVDLSGLAAGSRTMARERAFAAAFGRPFELARGPLVRTLLVRSAPSEHGLLVLLHHIVSDGWSTALFVGELGERYAARVGEGDGAPLRDLPIQYGDHAAWLEERAASATSDAGLAYWRERLAGAPVLELPTDRPRPLERSGRGGLARTVLPAPLADGVDRLAARATNGGSGGTGRSGGAGVTRYMALLTAFQVVLGRLSGQRDLTVGSPVAGRSRPELEELIGFFINTLVLRADLAGAPSFAEALERTRRTVVGALDHQDVPFERLVDALAPDRTLGHTPLFQAMFVLQSAPAVPRLDLPGLRLAPLALERTTARWDLSLVAEPAGESRELAFALEYDADLFDRTTARRLLGHLAVLLDAAVERPETPIEALPLLTRAERQQVVEWNGSAWAEPGVRGGDEPAPLPARFRAWAARRPDAVAVSVGERSLTYGGLLARAEAMAERLRGVGVGPESVVGLCAERSLELVVGLLGILEAGGAYLPLDPGVPAARLALILEDASPAAVLVGEGLEEALPAGGAAPRLALRTAETRGGAAPALSRAPVAAPAPARVSPEHLAYVIYTSGSTGRPKGTLISHRAAARLFDATSAWFGFDAERGPDGVWTLFHSYAFDFSVWELWGPLAHGGRLEIVPYWVSRSPEAFLELLRSRRVTVLSQTPSAFKQLVAADAASRADSGAVVEPPVRDQVVFGGEALEPASLAPWIERYGAAGPALVNLYGITETTVHVTCRRVTAADVGGRGGSPIGVPIPDLRVHLLDASMSPVPLGVPGEIHVGGPGLARGYLDRPGLTGARFVPDPYAGSIGLAGERLYKAGDLARRLPDGSLDFLGRIDHQVKIRGFRIELGEIEAVLSKHPAVAQVAVVDRADADRSDPGGSGGGAYLAAYVVVEADREVGFAALREHAAQLLPDYMVPTAWHRLEALPLTANGKLDRRALPAPDAAPAGDGAEYVAPRGPVEAAVAAVYAEVLGVERAGRRVGARDDFFALGGHSLLATQVVSRLGRALGVEPTLRELFEAPVVSDLARKLAERVEGVPADATGSWSLGAAGRESRAELLSRSGPRPLSAAQRRIWFLDRLLPGSPLYNIPARLALTGPLRVASLAGALGGIVARHEVLRVRVAERDDGPVQVVAPWHRWHRRRCRWSTSRAWPRRRPRSGRRSAWPPRPPGGRSTSRASRWCGRRCCASASTATTCCWCSTTWWPTAGRWGSSSARWPSSTGRRSRGAGRRSSRWSSSSRTTRSWRRSGSPRGCWTSSSRRGPSASPGSSRSTCRPTGRARPGAPGGPAWRRSASARS